VVHLGPFLLISTLPIILLSASAAEAGGSMKLAATLETAAVVENIERTPIKLIQLGTP
jgi:hypothetical protein